MAENIEDNKSVSQDPSSLYEDASALLMLSRGQEERRGSKARSEDEAENRREMASRPESQHNSSEPRSPLTYHRRGSQIVSPDEKRDLSSSPTPSLGSSSKGRVAAAALAAAATVPLPLKKQDQEHQETKNRPAETSSIKPNGTHDWPVPATYVVDPDAGVITCICGFDDDDGFTIQCDHCNRWQHAVCYGIRDIETAPDDHLCCACHPRKVDAKRAKRKQQERLAPKNNKRRRKSFQDEDQNGKSVRSSSVADSGNTSANGAGSGESSLVPEPKAIEKLLTAAEHYSVVYAPLSSNDFKDQYVKKFLDTHSDDDWVLPYNQATFKAVPLEVRSYEDNARSFSGLPKLGLFITQECPSGTFLEEVLGEVDFSKQYYRDPRNNYRVYGTTKPRVFMHPNWPVCIDTRLCGNLTRFLRRSCQPNVELVSIRMKSDKPDVRFVLRALRDLEDGEELHIGWQWDLRHPIWHLIRNKNKTVDSLDEQNKFTLVHSIDTILGTTDCACGKNNRDCYLLKVKKYSQLLVKSAKSKTNSRYKLGEILQAARDRVNKRPQTSILSRLAHEAIISAERANEMLVDFHAAKLKYSKEEGVQQSRDGPTFKSDESTHAKPFKFFLVDKHFTIERSNALLNRKISEISDSRLNPLQYDESHITDLRALPLPIELQLPQSPSGATESSKVATQTGDLHSLPASSVVGNATVAASVVPGSADFRNSLKKKLSFADYKKKMKPV
ncbi:LAME_0A05864g1_1 [Lachancea meyersii CBS 8951]|uniref:LAME_0A05864g1_1 n=1 Tax=Lachancea meyersii CBS 8951 TaxID=1266667 RepID=A0A1G4IQM4_9SACH|nr:LAME_0A05864g1_1 [Lachancea meyersii CBS 8951]